MDFTLDVAKWRCGQYSLNQLGDGPTRLLNKEGFMCCLGQVAKQCMDVTDDDIVSKIDPESLFVIGSGRIHDPSGVLVEKPAKTSPSSQFNHQVNNNLAKVAMKINDDSFISNTIRAARLKSLFEEHGHTLNVINDHLLESGDSDED